MRTHSANIFSIATGSSEPIYRQLVEQVRRLVAGGQLEPGDAMPSVREIASTLALNPMTVSKVYGILEMEGVLTRRRGLGMIVADAPKHAHSADTRADLLRPALQRVALEARQLELDDETVLALLTRVLQEQREA